MGAMASRPCFCFLRSDNVLATPDDRVSGILDFEFVARDWRVMELAVCLSKYVGDAEPLPLVEVRRLQG